MQRLLDKTILIKQIFWLIFKQFFLEPHLLSRLAFNSIKAKCAKDGQIDWKQCVWRTPNIDGFRQRNVSNIFIRFPIILSILNLKINH